MNKALLYLLTLVLTLLATGCEPVATLDVKATTDEEAPLRLCVLPTDEMPGLQRRYTPFQRAIAEKVKRPVELVVGPDYDSLGALLGQGKVELAWFSGISYLRSRSKYPMVPIAKALLRNSSTYRGVIVVRADSPIQSVDDLRGKRFAYVDRDSGSGFVAPNRTLTAAGISPLADFASVTFTYNHLVSLQGVLDGRFDAAAVYENAPATYRGKMDASKLRVLAATKEVPKDILACATTVSDDIRNKIWTLLEELPRTEPGKAVLRELERSNPIDGFERMRPDE